MNNLKRISGAFVILILGQIALFGQYTVETYQDPIKAEVVMQDLHDPYAFVVQYDENPCSHKSYPMDWWCEVDAHFPEGYVPGN